MPVDAVSAGTFIYSPDQAAGAYTQPASAPDTSSTQPPQSSSGTAQTTPAEPQQQPQQTQVYFFDANLGQYVNILV